MSKVEFVAKEFCISHHTEYTSITIYETVWGELNTWVKPTESSEKRNMLTDLNKPVDFLITVLANEPVSIGLLTDEPLMNDM